MPEPLLNITGLQAAYGRVRVLWGIDLTVEKGRVAAVIGPNGSGKSTLLRAVAGLRPPRLEGRGGIHLEDVALGGLAPEKIVGLGVSLVPEGGRVFAEMTCRDNLLVGAHTLTDNRLVRQRLDEMEDRFPILARRADQTAGTLSGGERQMLALARAMMSRPRLLLLDEPSLGLSPKMVDSVFGMIGDIARSGVSVLLVEQKVGPALRMCHEAHVLENGRITMSGQGDELLNDAHVRKAYLVV